MNNDREVTRIEEKMTDKTPPYIKLNERNHVEKSLCSHLGRPGRGVIVLVQDLLTGKKRITSLLENIS